MNPETLLIPFCFGFIGVMLLVIIVPFLRGKSDLLTSWNLFLLGSINYVGISGLFAAYQPDHFRILDYTRQDYIHYMIGVVAFFVPLLLIYKFFKLPRRLAGMTLRRWPPINPAILYVVLAVSMVFALASIFPPPIEGLRQVVAQLGNKSIVFAVGMAFAAWYRDRANPVLIGTLVAALFLSLVIAIAAGGGRRTMLGVLVTIPICWYWFWARYRSALFNATVFGTVGALAFVVLFAYSQVRHFDRRGERQERNLSSAAETLTKLTTAEYDEQTLMSMLGQNACQTSLAAIQLYTTEYDPEPFHSVYFVSTIWVPRTFWESKPRGLGFTLPKTSRVRGTRATWGPGIVGHGYHEGGWPMLVFYAFVMGTFLRYLDELLVRESQNAYLLAGFAVMSPHIFGWTRGDIGTFSIQIIGSFIVLILTGLLGRVLFGTGVKYPRTSGREYINTNLFALRRQKLNHAV